MADPTSAATPDIGSLNLFSLKGKNAIVTGGSRGIGAGIAMALAEAGARVCIVQRDAKQSATVDEIKKRGYWAQVIEADLSDVKDAQTVFERGIDIFDGRVDILVNCSGLLKRCPSTDVSEADWDYLMNVNLKSLFFLCQAAGKHMIPRRQGKIINIASLNSFIGGDQVAPYTASKGGVSQLTKALSNEWSKYNIQVNALAPGFIATDINTDLRSNPDVEASRTERCPAGRWGSPLDFAGPAVFLASQASQYISGAVIVVDGGVLGW